jgi:uncharacterized protein (TIGR02145 family)
MRRCILFFLMFNLITVLPETAKGQVTDIDGNQYPTVIIGTQEWMAENLRSSRLHDGTLIPQITSNTAWFGADGMAMCWYNNDSAGHHWPYGRMYNGYAAEMQNICPDGWQVPTTAEWDAMITFLGGSSVAGGKLKDSGFVYWEPPNTGATNSSGFAGLPGGFRSHLDGTFNYKGQRGGWFVRQPGGGLSFRFLSWSLESSGSGPVTISMGLSIRCMRTISSTEKPETDDLLIRIYPIPTMDQLHIDLGMIPEVPAEVLIKDMTGRTVRVAAASMKVTTIDLSDQPAGMYIVQVIINGELTQREKIIVSHTQ